MSTAAVRTPEERFEGLPGFAFRPRYRQGLGAAAAFHLKPDDLAPCKALASWARILDLPPRTMSPKRYA